MQEVKVRITANSRQKECIETLNGPVMVLAGPGTGKTFTIIERLEYMVENGIKPASVLCLTFTDAAAAEMKSRLLKKLGPISSNINITTYHSFANEIIRRFPSKFELFDGVRLVDEISSNTIMKECMDEYSPKALTTKWGDSYYFIPEALNSVSEIKKNLVSKNDYFDVIENHSDWIPRLKELEAEKAERIEKNKPLKTFLNTMNAHIKKIEKAKEIWAIYELYSKKLAERNFIDFNDMINLVVEAFQTDKELLSEASKGYEYFLVDEYQDTNLLQNKITDSLVRGSKSNNIFVVGDDDQIIYGFQGARIDNLEHFLQKYPETKIICLNENQRSTQSILDLSYAVINQDPYRLEANKEFQKHNISKKLTAKNPEIIKLDKKPTLTAFQDQIQENNHLVKEIQNIIKSENLSELSKIAVLTRNNDELQEFKTLLESENIPCQLKVSKSIFELKPSILAYFYLRAVENSFLHSDKLFGLLMSEPFRFNEKDYAFLLEAQKPFEKDFTEVIRENIDHNWADKDRVVRFLSVFDSLKAKKSYMGIKSFVIEVFNQTGILAYFAATDENKVENIAALKRLADEAQSFQNLYKSANLGDFTKHLDGAFTKNLAINIEQDKFIQNAVQLVTIHSSKGREFDYVFLPNLTSRAWEKRSRNAQTSLPIIINENFDKKELQKSEQLKLLFVGITRAKHSLYLSYASENSGKTQELTSYIAETGENLLDTRVISYNENSAQDEIVKLLSKKNIDAHKKFEQELKERIESLVLSAHSINTYLRCPRSFLYSYIYKIPIWEEYKDNRNYGSAIHKTIEYALDSAKENGEYPLKSNILEVFQKKLENYRFESETIYNQYKSRGEKCLENYYNRLIATRPERIFDIEKNLGTIELSGVRLTGIIDRIETAPDNGSDRFDIYDYKTGTAKKEKEVSLGGKNEDYFIQLGLYKMLFEKKYEGKKVEQLGLIFVEEPENNIYKTISKEEELEILEIIKTVKQNIQNSVFPPIDGVSTKHDNCKYCSYKMLCTLDEI